MLQIPGARSLKDRRQVVRSFKERVQARLRISVAEVGDLERVSCAVVAMAVVSNDAAYCDEVLAKAASMASTLSNAVLADHATEIVSFGRGGSGIRGGIEQFGVSPDSEVDSSGGGGGGGGEEGDADAW